MITKLMLMLCLLFPTVALAESVIRDRSGSVIYTKSRQGNQIIYRDRSGSVIATESLERRRDRSRDRRVPLAPLVGEED